MRPREVGSSAFRLFRIEVRGEFGDLLRSAFDDVSIRSEEGRTVLIASVRDEQHLYGIMDRLRDLGVQIISLREVQKD